MKLRFRDYFFNWVYIVLTLISDWLYVIYDVIYALLITRRANKYPSDDCNPEECRKCKEYSCSYYRGD